MGKKISLKQFEQKKYKDVPGLSEKFTNSFGDIEDAFDCIIYGASGNGKTNFTIDNLSELIIALDAKCNYISYEEGHTKTLRKAMIERHNLLEKIGNRMDVWDHLTFEELDAQMEKRKSAKIWVIDSLQASNFSAKQCAYLKHKYVLSRRRKIIFYISWAKGKFPSGSVAVAVEYYAHIKIRVEGLVAFFKSRFGGNQKFIIWEEGAIRYWGLKKVNQFKKGK